MSLLEFPVVFGSQFMQVPLAFDVSMSYKDRDSVEMM